MKANKRKETALYQQQPYDSTLKALFEANTRDMLEFAIGSPVGRVTELSGEVLKPPLRIDRGYKSWYKGKAHIVHVELETDSKGEIIFRMVEYFGMLYRRHKKPVRSTVIYPFRTTVPKVSLRVTCQENEVEVPLFDLRIIKLWEIEAQSFMQQWSANLYALVPTMNGADYAVLSHALDAMKKFYANQRRVLATKLVLFDVFLRRSDTVSEEDRRRIMQKMEPFADLLAESPFIQKAAAAGEAKGRALGRALGKEEGRVETLRGNILKIVRVRFPRLTKVAQQKIKKVTVPGVLDELFNQLLAATDEQAARLVFEGLES